MSRIDPLRNFRYRLEIDNITQAGFSEVAIAETAPRQEGNQMHTILSQRAGKKSAPKREERAETTE